MGVVTTGNVVAGAGTNPSGGPGVLGCAGTQPDLSDLGEVPVAGAWLANFADDPDPQEQGRFVPQGLVELAQRDAGAALTAVCSGG